VKQAQVDKLYASLKDLAGDRRLKLDEVLKLYMLNRDIEDLEQWIAEREVVAGSHELGQDFEHVTVGDVFQYLDWLICVGTTNDFIFLTAYHKLLFVYYFQYFFYLFNWPIFWSYFRLGWFPKTEHLGFAETAAPEHCCSLYVYWCFK